MTKLSHSLLPRIDQSEDDILKSLYIEDNNTPKVGSPYPFLSKSDYVEPFCIENLQSLKTHGKELLSIFAEPYKWKYSTIKGEYRIKWSTSQREKFMQHIKSTIKQIEQIETN